MGEIRGRTAVPRRKPSLAERKQRVSRFHLRVLRAVDHAPTKSERPLVEVEGGADILDVDNAVTQRRGHAQLMLLLGARHASGRLRSDQPPRSQRDLKRESRVGVIQTPDGGFQSLDPAVERLPPDPERSRGICLG